jgi:glutathione peroxidase
MGDKIDMTGRQKILKAIYPLWIGFTKLTGKNTKILANNKKMQPVQSIYDLNVPLNNGNTLPLQTYKGKKLLLVNTASDCGYTNQYEDLQKLYERFNNQLEIIAFPANDFGEQEKGNNQEIAQFCKVNFGVTFPLANKSVVIKSDEQNNIFKWLTNKKQNGWNDQAPSWNFSKYLINEQGELTHYFDPSVSPLSKEVINAIEAGK